MQDRKLELIPIAHTGLEAAAVFEPDQDVVASRICWGINDFLDSLPRGSLRGKKTYIDTFPIGREDLRLAFTMRRSGLGTPGFQIISRLAEAGVQIMGTEDPELIERLEKEKRDLSWLVGRKKDQGERNFKKRLLDTIPQRDRFIAKNIAQTLGLGEEGILLIGYKHNVQAYLPKGIITHTPEVIISHVTEADLRMIDAWDHYQRHLGYNLWSCREQSLGAFIPGF